MSKDPDSMQERFPKDEGQENQLKVNTIVLASDRVELGASTRGDYY